MRRVQQKQQTREKVLSAARILFASQGYEAATLRQVAKLAGVSVGSVFTTFKSKEDMLLAIAVEGYDSLAGKIEAEAVAADSARERLKRGFRTAYEHEFQRLGLLMAQVGASWTWSHTFETQSQARLARPFGFIGALTRAAQEAGEVRAELDLGVLNDVLLGLYLRTLRHGWYRQLSAAQMADFADQQIDLIFDGAAAKPCLSDPVQRT